MMKNISYPLAKPATKAALNYNGRSWKGEMELRETKLIELVLQNEKQNQKNAEENLLIHGDCLNACAFLKSVNKQVDLIYIDPPFASGTNYAKKIMLRNGTQKGIKISDNTIGKELLYGDTWKKEDYLNWFAPRLLAMKAVMSSQASIFVHLDWHIGHYVKVLLDEIFGDENFRNEIIWWYPSGAEQNKQFNRKHDNIFWYSKNKTGWTFNYDDVVIPYTKEQAERFDLWDAEKKKHFYWNVNPRGERVKTYIKKGLSEYDVWNIGINATEIRDIGYYTAKPTRLLEKIIKAASDKNMVVADFFSGSGVTAKVAHELGRKFIACDVGNNAIQTSRDRLVKSKASFGIYKIKNKKPIEKTTPKDEVDFELKKIKNGARISIKKYSSTYLTTKFAEYNHKKIKKATRGVTGKIVHKKDGTEVKISNRGLELIESVQFDTTMRKDGVWVSNPALEDKAGIKEKIKGNYDLLADNFKIKIRNIAGEEIIINSSAIK